MTKNERELLKLLGKVIKIKNKRITIINNK